MKAVSLRIGAQTVLLGISLFAFGVQLEAQASGKPPETNCCSAVENALQVVGRIHKGLRRADIEREFVVDGGLFSRQQTRYSLRACPEIKVNITFALDKAVDSFVEGSPNDSVSAFSNSYLEYPAKD